MPSPLRILYSSDLHGNTAHYRRFLAASVAERADLLVLGGDLFPGGRSRAAAMEAQKNFITERMGPRFRDFKNTHPHKKIYLMMGNDDFAVHMHLLEGMESDGVINLLHLRSYPLPKGLFLAGYGCVPPTPFLLKDWERLDAGLAPIPKRRYRASDTGELVPIEPGEWFLSRPSIREDLESLTRLSDPSATIYVTHAPPHGTHLDVLYNGYHAGSLAVREFIEKYSPPLTLHGHIHESPRMTGEIVDRLGDTLCVNPGQERRLLRAVIIEIGFAGSRKGAVPPVGKARPRCAAPPGRWRSRRPAITVREIDPEGMPGGMTKG